MPPTFERSEHVGASYNLTARPRHNRPTIQQSSMTTTLQPSKNARITGWILSILPVLVFSFSAAMKFIMPPEAAKGFEASIGEVVTTNREKVE